MTLIADPPSNDFSARSRRPLITLRPPGRWSALRLLDLYEFRDLLFTLAQRDVKLRYKQTLLGVIWVVLQPLLAAGIFTFVFSLVAKLPSDGVPYFLFSFAGLLGWNLFNNILTRSSGCLVANANLISKIFFPRLVLPVATMGSALVDFAVAAGMVRGPRLYLISSRNQNLLHHWNLVWHRPESIPGLPLQK